MARHLSGFAPTDARLSGFSILPVNNGGMRKLLKERSSEFSMAGSLGFDLRLICLLLVCMTYGKVLLEEKEMYGKETAALYRRYAKKYTKKVEHATRGTYR